MNTTLLAQSDRATEFYSVCWEFESLRGCQLPAGGKKNPVSLGDNLGDWYPPGNRWAPGLAKVSPAHIAMPATPQVLDERSKMHSER